MRKKIWGKDTKYGILNVGSLKTQKDHFNLIEAFSLLKFHKNCRLLIIGDGPLKYKLKKFPEHFDMFQKRNQINRVIEKKFSIKFVKIFNEKYQQKGCLNWTVYKHSL